MPAIEPLEDLKVTQRDYRSMFLAATPNDLPACSKPLALRSLGACAPKRYSAQVRRKLAKESPLPLTPDGKKGGPGEIEG